MCILDYHRSHGDRFESLLHQPASSSAKRAGNVHVPGRGVAKAVLVKAGDSFVLAVLPSTSWIDLGRLSEVVGTTASDIRLATTDELLAIFPDCEPGAVPPFGRLYGLTTLVDSGLAEVPDIVLGANTRHEGLRMHFKDFQALEQPKRASFTRPSAANSKPAVEACPDRNHRAR
jgi:Ala-tRNA(Pro) deacylase